MGTYRGQPQEGHERMKIGVEPFTDERQIDRLPGMLLLPFHQARSSSMERRIFSDDQSGKKHL